MDIALGAMYNLATVSEVPPDWVCREVLLRRDAIVLNTTDEQKSFSAWNEILALAQIAFGNHLTVQDLMSAWMKNYRDFLCSLNAESGFQHLPLPAISDLWSSRSNANQGSNLPQSSNTLGNENDEVSGNAGMPELTPEGLPTKNHHLSPNSDTIPNLKPVVSVPPAPIPPFIPAPKRKRSGEMDWKVGFPTVDIYKLIVREVLKRARILCSRRNSKSRAPAANKARWDAWEEIRAIVQQRFNKDLPVEQVQMVWRHQRTKIPDSLVEQSFDFPGFVNDAELDQVFHLHYYNYYSEERTHSRFPSSGYQCWRDFDRKVSADERLSHPLRNMSTVVSPVVPSPGRIRTRSSSCPPSFPPNSNSEGQCQSSHSHSPSPSNPEDPIGAPERKKSKQDTKLVDKVLEASYDFYQQSLAMQRMQMELTEKFFEVLQRIQES